MTYALFSGRLSILITWFHEARRDILKLHPRWDKNVPLTGDFATRSPDRPNPLGLNRSGFSKWPGIN